ncbi:uncharacterized protein A4U43_C03F25460 [Asparagus officinalis]|uniref:Pectinesterase n=1 Tax=Asparagus officinalis TaxID=4686 RepID=A0A5P1FH66_ASPOF|nr:pectinesterase QRT1 [Asparagus officinalis]ONK76239.1 uncharacterized protein A4U43_C03F25460 [Asparagus officinalis]
MDDSSALLLHLLLLISLCGISIGSKFITWDDLSLDDWPGKSNFNDGLNSRTRVISVSRDGKSDSTTVQGAVDMVPDGNTQRVKIFIHPGIYREKVTIPITKPYLSFIGNGKSRTTISWHLKASDTDAHGQVIGTMYSASVTVEADYFCAHGIAFENTAAAQAEPGAKGMQAVALRLSGDKAMLYHCKILGSQDTLFDHMGRHYFLRSYIRGSIDFIFGNAKSLYEGCTLHANAASYGAITASQRKSNSEDSGFSFVKCKLKGTGMLYLGRAWGRYARVVYSYCKFPDIIIPEGWNDWGDPSRRSSVWFGEFNCTGEGAKSRDRVQWSRSLNYDEARPFLDQYYINGEEWLRL